jgi:hypothetical protein
LGAKPRGEKGDILVIALRTVPKPNARGTKKKRTKEKTGHSGFSTPNRPVRC